MRRLQNASLLCGTIALLLSLAPLHAEPAGTNPPAPAAPSAPSPFAGPAQRIPPKTSLVSPKLDGTVERIDGLPEQAALRLLELSDAEQSAAAEILASRGAAIDRFVLGNIPLLTELGTAFATTGPAAKLDQTRLLMRTAALLHPEVIKVPLATQLQSVLTKANHAAMVKLTHEYWDAVMAERRSTLPEGTKFDRGGLMFDESAKALGKEIELSFHRVVKSGSLHYAYIMKEISVSPEQEGKLRTFIADYVKETGGEGNDEQNKRLFWRVSSVLDSQQQTALLRNIADLTANKGKPVPALANTASKGAAVPAKRDSVQPK